MPLRRRTATSTLARTTAPVRTVRPPVVLNVYDVKLPNRKALMVARRVSLAVVVLAIAYLPIGLIWAFWYTFNVYPYEWERINLDPPAGPEIWHFALAAGIALFAGLILTQSIEKYEKYFTRVRQGEILDMTDDSDGHWIQIRGNTWANEERIYWANVNAKFFTSTRDNWRDKRISTVQL